jgi:AraC-like DNA-binding protein
MIITNNDIIYHNIPTHRIVGEYLYLYKIDRNYYPDIEKPHRHDFFEILWFTKAGGEHIVDFTSYTIEKEQLFFLSPPTVHALNTYKKEGFLIVLSQNFLSELSYFLEDSFLSLFNNFSSQFSFVMNGNEAETAHNIFELLFKEYQRKPTDTRLLVSYCRSFLLFTQQIMERQPSSIPKEERARMAKLYLHIEEFFKREKQAEFYAKKLELSTKHLNSLTKEVLGLTVAQLIRNRIIFEAKRELHLNQHTIYQIANHLGYHDPAYFSRFFKKETGFSPKEYQNLKEKN